MAGRKTIAAAVLIVAGILAACPAFAATAQKKQNARSQFDRAETLRIALELKPSADRKLADYQEVLRLYRNVTILAPTLHQAAESLFYSGELNKEMALHFPKDGVKYRAEARRQYQALLKEYPENKFRTQTNQALALLDLPATPAAPAIVAPMPMPVDAEVPAAPHAKGAMAQVSSIREWSTPSYTRVVIAVDDEVKFEAGRIASPDRIYFDLHNTHPIAAMKDYSKDIDDGLLKKVRLGVNKVGTTRVVLEVGQITTYSAFLLPNPYRLVIDIQGTTKPSNSALSMASNTPPAPVVVDTPKPKLRARVEPPPALPFEREPRTVETVPVAINLGLSEREIADTTGPTSEPVFEKISRTKPTRAGTILAPSPTSSGQRSLTRALGLKIGRIVIDAGHGGHDTGTIGPSGYTEKELTLDVATRLGQMLQERMGSEVVYTRDDDTFIPLETRTAIANQKQADLFVSVHANASRDTQARGVETYYLSFSTSPEAMELAARENAVSEKSIHELQDLVKKITLYEKVEESKEFASDVQKAMYTGLTRGAPSTLRNRGVKKAPFVVLIGANMPSILAEISFVSNPQDEKLLRKPEYRQKIAESLFRGIQHYSNSLGGVKVASLREGTRE